MFVDGTWQKRGFSSLNAVVKAISVKSCKVLDIGILHMNCKSSNLMEEIHKTEYQCYDTSHICLRALHQTLERVGYDILIFTIWP